MKTIREVLTLSAQYFQERGIDHARREAEDMLSDALGMKRIALYMDFDRPLTSTELAMCRERLVRRGRGEPLAYIHGEVEFSGCTFAVNPSVLIPRQETELLVEKVATELTKSALHNATLWDVCCGSGCIGIALKKKFPELTVELSDLSTEAVALARANALRNQVEVTVHQGDLLAPFLGRRAHFVVCNPPYVAEEEYATLAREVRQHEPRMALVASDRGCSFYRRLSEELANYLHPAGKVWLEIGCSQGPAVSALFSGDSWIEKVLEKDWAGHDRFFMAVARG